MILIYLERMKRKKGLRKLMFDVYIHSLVRVRGGDDDDDDDDDSDDNDGSKCL